MSLPARRSTSHSAPMPCRTPGSGTVLAAEVYKMEIAKDVVPRIVGAPSSARNGAPPRPEKSRAHPPAAMEEFSR